MDNLSKLPVECFATMRSDPSQVILIRRGEKGYYPVTTRATADKLNSTLEPVPTSAQVKAMEAGSMWGFDVPAADPAVWE